MSLSSRMVVVLTGVGLLSGGFLASVGILTKDRIALNKKMEIERAIVSVVPGSVAGETLYEEKEFIVYGGKNEAGDLQGFAIYTSGIGFQDKIVLMIGVDASLSRLNGLAVLDQKETPGLGAKITDRPSFLVYWENKDFTRSFSLRKPPAPAPESLSASEVNTITGATISSEAVLSIVNAAREKVRALREEGKLALGGPHAE
ncbi:MAG TPA: FMN-binding protein [Candidatus Desulfaltia sp.]|nr:FMN-binding protein [Candidatus Desulfaltia sp.]